MVRIEDRTDTDSELDENELQILDDLVANAKKRKTMDYSTIPELFSTLFGSLENFKRTSISNDAATTNSFYYNNNNGISSKLSTSNRIKLNEIVVDFADDELHIKNNYTYEKIIAQFNKHEHDNDNVIDDADDDNDNDNNDNDDDLSSNSSDNNVVVANNINNLPIINVFHFKMGIKSIPSRNTTENKSLYYIIPPYITCKEMYHSLEYHFLAVNNLFSADLPKVGINHIQYNGKIYKTWLHGWQCRRSYKEDLLNRNFPSSPKICVFARDYITLDILCKNKDLCKDPDLWLYALWTIENKYHILTTDNILEFFVPKDMLKSGSLSKIARNNCFQCIIHRDDVHLLNNIKGSLETNKTNGSMWYGIPLLPPDYYLSRYCERIELNEMKKKRLDSKMKHQQQQQKQKLQLMDMSHDESTIATCYSKTNDNFSKKEKILQKRKNFDLTKNLINPKTKNELTSIDFIKNKKKTNQQPHQHQQSNFENQKMSSHTNTANNTTTITKEEAEIDYIINQLEGDGSSSSTAATTKPTTAAPSSIKKPEASSKVVVPRISIQSSSALPNLTVKPGQKDEKRKQPSASSSLVSNDDDLPKKKQKADETTAAVVKPKVAPVKIAVPTTSTSTKSSTTATTIPKPVAISASALGKPTQNTLPTPKKPNVKHVDTDDEDEEEKVETKKSSSKHHQQQQQQSQVKNNVIKKQDRKRKEISSDSDDESNSESDGEEERHVKHQQSTPKKRSKIYFKSTITSSSSNATDAPPKKNSRRKANSSSTVNWLVEDRSKFMMETIKNTCESKKQKIDADSSYVETNIFKDKSQDEIKRMFFNSMLVLSRYCQPLLTQLKKSIKDPLDKVPHPKLLKEQGKKVQSYNEDTQKLIVDACQVFYMFGADMGLAHHEPREVKVVSSNNNKKSKSNKVEEENAEEQEQQEEEEEQQQEEEQGESIDI